MSAFPLECQPGEGRVAVCPLLCGVPRAQNGACVRQTLFDGLTNRSVLFCVIFKGATNNNCTKQFPLHSNYQPTNSKEVLFGPEFLSLSPFFPLPLPVRDLLKLNRLDGAPDTKTAQQSLRWGSAEQTPETFVSKLL